MKKIPFISVFLLLLHSSIFPIVLCYEVPSNILIYVDDDNTEGPWDGTIHHPYQYIQDGIDAADNGDTVFVYSGIYKKEIYEEIKVNKTIKLIGENKNTTIIDGFGQVYGISIFSDSVFISGFTIKKASDSGIGIFSNLNTISENNITLNDYSGILCISSKSNQ